MKILALPGLDGTGDLFRWLEREAPEGFAVEPVSYPPDRGSGVLNYPAHLEVARRWLPADGPFLLLGESFSGPVAVRLAAEAPPGLVGLILCATFVRPPSWSGFRHLPWQTLFSRPVPRHVIRRRLAGAWMSPEIVRAVREVTRKVDP
ncbi:MAG: alpha/beta hydrolase, partial [Acidobacteriota bacterium]